MKNELVSLKDYSLDGLSFGELIKRHLEDLSKLSAAIITDIPVKTYITGLTTRSVTYDKLLVKIMFNEESKKISDADTIRDLALASLIKVVKVFNTSDVITEIEASRVLLALLNNYKGLAKFDYEKESIGIENLVADLESATYNKHVTTLNLGRYITRIKTSNASFRALFAGRVSVNASKEVFDSKTIRKEYADYYHEFCMYIQAMANASAAPAQFVTILNLLNTARKYYADKLARHESVLESHKKAKDIAAKAN